MIKIGSRGSKLALWQANYLYKRLKSINISSEVMIIKTKGDKIQHLSFDKIEGKGFFTKELEDALLENKIDIAVHSMKDLPTDSPDGLCISAVSSRANPADLLIYKKSLFDRDKVYGLPSGAKVGTSSSRRKCLIKYFVKDVNLEDIRGNVPTRIQKLKDDQFDAIILASAGIERLQIDLASYHTVELNPTDFVPAPAQGVLAYQTRTGDIELRKKISAIHSSETASATNVERKVLSLFEGGCHMPIGVYCKKDTMGYFHAYGMYAETWEATPRFARISQSTNTDLAEKLFKELKGNN